MNCAGGAAGKKDELAGSPSRCSDKMAMLMATRMAKNGLGCLEVTGRMKLRGADDVGDKVGKNGEATGSPSRYSDNVAKSRSHTERTADRRDAE